MGNITKQLRRAIQRFGYDVHRVGRKQLGRDHVSDIKLLCGGAVQTIFDVGANTGQAARRFREDFVSSDIHSFEPFPQAFAELKKNVSGDLKIFPHNTALGDRAGKAVLHLQQGSELNSLLSPATSATRHITAAAMQSVGECEISITTLDEFCREQNVSAIDLLKIDTQGFEMQVLRGARATLESQRIRTLFLEVNFVALYQAQPSLGEIIDFLEPLAYRFVGLYEPAYADEGYLKWADALFVGATPQRA